jgi:class 3 adenylate cyclase
MVPRFVRWLYAKLGRRYPRWVLIGQFQVAYLITLAGLGLLLLYQPMSGREFLLLLAVGEALVVLENLASSFLVVRLLRPVDAWLAGDRGEEATVAAWRTLVDMPWKFARKRKLKPIFFTLLPWCAVATWVLDLSVWSFALLALGACVMFVYGSVLRFLGMELSLRPVLEDVARALPDRTQLPSAGFSLKGKLLVLVPLINFLTGVAVAGLAQNSRGDLSDLGADAAVALAVALTISLELSVLLTRSIVGPISSLRDAARSVGGGDLTVRVPVLSTDETGALSRAFNDAVSGLEERERLREAFGAFVDPEIAERVAREGSVLEGEEVEVSIVFVDIRGFTAFAERSNAHEVVTLLNDYYERLVPVLLRHGGHANKFVGDGLLGVFGAPDRLPEHADRAVAAALEMVELVRDAYGGEVRIGIGVNSGPVVAGTIGGGGRVEFTVIGDAVNTAARVEGATRETGDDVLITEATHCLLSDGGVGWQRCHQDVTLKGKSEHVRLYMPRPAEEDVAAAVEAAAAPEPASHEQADLPAH